MPAILSSCSACDPSLTAYAKKAYCQYRVDLSRSQLPAMEKQIDSAEGGGYSKESRILEKGLAWKAMAKTGQIWPIIEDGRGDSRNKEIKSR